MGRRYFQARHSPGWWPVSRSCMQRRCWSRVSTASQKSFASSAGERRTTIAASWFVVRRKQEATFPERRLSCWDSPAIPYFTGWRNKASPRRRARSLLAAHKRAEPVGQRLDIGQVAGLEWAVGVARRKGHHGGRHIGLHQRRAVAAERAEDRVLDADAPP